MLQFSPIKEYKFRESGVPEYDSTGHEFLMIRKGGAMINAAEKCNLKLSLANVKPM